MSTNQTGRRSDEPLMRLIKGGYMPILLDNAVDPLFICEVVREAGLPAVEYTLRRHDLGTLPLIRKEFDDLLLIIGSVIDQPDVAGFVQSRRPFHTIAELHDLGADGIVSYLPFRDETYRRFAGRMILAPGVETAARGFEQLAKGADLIKIVGMEPRWIATMEAATQNTLPMLLTGVPLDEIEACIAGGTLVTATGLEYSLASPRLPSLTENPDRSALLDRLLAFKEGIAAARRRLGHVWDTIQDPLELLAATGRYHHSWACRQPA